MKNIVLIGFMGSGKSTVAKVLKSRTKMKIIDTDREITKRAGMTIPEIFEKHGEEYFRNLETTLLEDLQSQENIIVSCGGGIVLKEENVAKMQKIGTVVLLSASPITTFHRVKNNTNRPLLNGNMNVPYIQKLMVARKPYYKRAAQVTVVVDHKGLRQVAEEIIEKVEGRG
ncbi:MAG: shikimate kinase [Eubacteriales bacterium]